MEEFGRIDKFIDELNSEDINTINSKYQKNNGRDSNNKAFSLKEIKKEITKNIKDHKSMSDNEFIESFLPAKFAASFSNDMNTFDRNQFINNEARGKRAFVTFAVMFRDPEFSIAGTTGKIVPSPKADDETTRKYMLDFINETVQRTELFFKKHELIKIEEFKALIRKYYDKLYIFKRYDTVIMNIKHGDSLEYDERLAYAFNVISGCNIYEAFARMLITIALEIYLFPQRKKNKGEFVFASKTNMDPQLALNVLWFTKLDGGDILDVKDEISGGKDSHGNKLDREEQDALNLSIANIAFSRGKTDKKYIGEAYDILIKFNDNRPKEEAVKSKTYLKALLKLVECAYIYKGKLTAYTILEKYNSYSPVDGSYYLFKFWKEAENAQNPQKGRRLLEKSTEYGNENAIMDLAKAYVEGDSALGCERDLKKAFELLENGLDNGYIKDSKGYCYSLMGKICTEEPSYGNSEKCLRKAKAYGCEIDSHLLNRARRIESKEPQKSDVDFYFTNSRSGANAYFRDALNTEKAVETGEDFNLDVFRDMLLSPSHTSLVAAFMCDDEEKNISDCIRFIDRLNKLNAELTGEEVRERKRKISLTEPELSEYLEASGTPEDEKAKNFVNNITGIRNALKNTESIKLGQSVMFRNLIKNADKLSEEIGGQTENFKKIFAEYEKLFALPEITKKLIESVKIFVKGDSEYVTSVIDTELNALEDNLYFRVKVVDYALAAAHELISERPLFAPYYESGEENTSVVIFGSGRVAEKIATETLACTVMGEAFSPSVTVIDDDVTDTENVVRGKCIALYNNPRENFNIKMPRFFSCPLNHPLMQNFVSDKSAEHGIEGLDDALREGNYFVVATDDDKFNINFAKMLRGWLLMTGDSFTRHPTIAVLVKNAATARAAQFLEVGGHNIGDSWYDNYGFFCFGQEEKIYSAHTLIEDANEKRAEFVHCSYCLSGDDREAASESNFVHENLSSFYRNFYNHESSLCTAYSLPYRLFAAGYRLNGIEDYYTEENYDILSDMASVFRSFPKEELNFLGMIEHSRWSAFMISRGWQKATREQFVSYIRRNVPKQQLFISKLHPYIVDWSLLDKIHDELTEMITDEFAKGKLRNPKDYDINSLIYTADFLVDFDLFGKLKDKQSFERG